MKLNCHVGSRYPKKVYTTRGIREFIYTGYHSSWSESISGRGFDSFLDQVFQPSTYTVGDLERMGLRVEYDVNRAPFLKTPYGECYLRDLPGYFRDEG